MRVPTLTTALLSVASIASAASTFSPARPPAIPLAVKSPYLSTWMQAGSDDGNGGYLTGRWQQHWSQSTTAMAGLIRVDGIAYEFMGYPSQRVSVPEIANQTAFEYTATRSVFTQNVGPVQIKTTFLSPIYPDDIKRASLVASYVQTEVSSTDGKSHNVQLYVDISGEWASGDSSSVITWDYSTTTKTSPKVAFHTFERETQLLFSEINDRAEWGSWYWTADTAEGLTFQSGADTTVRQTFVSNGSLPNTKDTNFRAIDDDYPVFAFSHDLGSVGASAVSNVYTLSLFQPEAIQFLGTGDVQSVPSLWSSYFADPELAITFFHEDYSNAAAHGDLWDSKIASDSKTAGGDDYATITTLATRQAFGAVQLCGDLTEQYIFLKEISSDGNVQTVDVIYPSMPIFFYANATYASLLLNPLFQNQEAGHYPNQYSMHDLGSSYPNATGHPDGNDEYQPLEECGNMLVMTLAYIQKSGDKAYGAKHYKILNQWTQYLINEALFPGNQLSTDDFAGALPNQTNLALKGIVGIASMAEIANLTGNTADAENFSSIAHSYIDTWQEYAINTNATPAHSVLSYNNQTTWSNLYNLYADKLVNTNLVPQKVYDILNAFYPTVWQEYGLPLDTRDTLAKGDWDLWFAAIGNEEVQTGIIQRVAKFINETPTSRPFTDLYDTVTGNWPDDGIQFNARPVVGGMFSLLALKA